MQVFFNKIQDYFNARLPFVVYRKPNKNVLHAIFQKDDFLHTTTTFSESGFVFAPFDLKNPSVLFKLEDCENDSAVYQDAESVSKKTQTEYFIDNEAVSKHNHVHLVKKGVEFIENSEFKKVVLSRKEEVKASSKNAIQWYKKLLKKHPSAMVYWWFHPKVGCWMGATPETLFHIKNDQFYTMALAGTQKFDSKRTTVWQEKEREEQQFVTDYIVEELQGKLSRFSVSSPKTVKSGNVVHLQTEIEGKVENLNSSIKDFVDALHPTPAVCGLPKEPAKQFILENEFYNREFYTGFLGELNLNKSTQLFVNLRCMKIEKNIVSVFTGGGITKDSIAESEWIETVYKSHNMKEILLVLLQR